MYMSCTCRSMSNVSAVDPGGGGGDTPRKIGQGCAARFQKPLPYFNDQNLRLIPYPIYGPTFKSKPNSDQC